MAKLIWGNLYRERTVITLPRIGSNLPLGGRGGEYFFRGLQELCADNEQPSGCRCCIGEAKRFVNVSSFLLYSKWNLDRGMVLDEYCEVESHPIERAEAYAFAKLKQEETVTQYGQEPGVPHAILRPGPVFGPGERQLTARVGIDTTFGIFLHSGGSNRIPLTYVDNCADAIVHAGLIHGVDGEVFNVVDDDLPSSRAADSS